MTIASYHNLIWIWIAIAVIIFPVAIKVSAPYGRHVRKGWGPLIDNKLGWVIMELPTLVLVPWLFFTGSADKSLIIWIFFGLYCFHYINRVFIFPLRIKTKGKKIPFTIVCFAFIFNLVNGGIIGYFLGSCHPIYAMDWLKDPRFIAGMLVFWTGLLINWRYDSILISLRKSNEQGYHIPRGGLFEKISCPNHFGEILEWLGYAIMIWALPAWSFAIWTMANLIPRTLNHHRWYKTKFPEYPKDRKAVIPFIL